MTDTPEIRCSLCGEPHDHTGHPSHITLAAPHAETHEQLYICETCIALSHDLVDAAKKLQRAKSQSPRIQTPAELHAVLDEHIIGQDAAKRILSVAAYNHLKRLFPADENDRAKIAKSNILLVGPSGCGKTLLAETLAKILSVPIAIADATTLTSAGYVGDDVETILARLLDAAMGDLDAAQKGILYLDEIDKIARKTESPSITRDVSGESVQQALLKIIESADATIPLHGRRKHPEGETITIDTRNILFICGGAFEGLDKAIANRLKTSTIGFAPSGHPAVEPSPNSALAHIEPDDLVRFGLIPELVGRLPIIVPMTELDEADLADILTRPKNSLLGQYQRLLGLDHIDLVFTPNAIQAIAREAIQRRTGARGLRAILERTLLDTMYQAPGLAKPATVTIDAATVFARRDALTRKRPGRETEALPNKTGLAA